jgi:copper transport protein
LAQALAALAIILSGMAIGASGHASVADPQWLMRPALVVHVTTIAWWVGALFPLIVLLGQDPRVSAPPLIAFSRAIPFAIVPLIGSGAVLAMVQLGPLGPHWWSPYGQILAAKFTLLFALFAIASLNRWVLTAPAVRGDYRAIQHMRRGIIAEIVIILAVLGLVSAWRFTPPPRALATEVGTPVTLDLANGSVTATVTLSSNRVGVVDVGIELSAAPEEPLSPKSVKLSLEPENGMMSPMTRAAEALTAGIWSVDELAIPLAGVWLVEVEIRMSDFELSKVQGTLEIIP